MTSGEIIEALAKKEELSKNKTRSIIKTLVQIIQTEVKVKGGHVSIAGLGIFESMVRKSRSARNPQTGEALVVPSKRVPKFRPSKAFREVVSVPKRVTSKKKVKTKKR